MGDPNAASRPRVLSVIVDQTSGGVYVPTIALDDRLLITLDRVRVLAYVEAWAEAIARAEHDAAVLSQLTGIGVDNAHAIAVVTKDLRPHRPPLNAEATAPLRLESILSSRTLRGQVAAFLDDEKIMQLDGPAVYDHIGKVLPAVATCALDNAYRSFMINNIDVSEGRANNMVHDLARWRFAETHNAEQDRPRNKFVGVAGAVRASRQGPASLPDRVQGALLTYASAVAAARDGRTARISPLAARQALAECCVAAGLDPAQVIPPLGASLNPGGRWIPPKRRGRNRGGGTPS